MTKTPPTDDSHTPGDKAPDSVPSEQRYATYFHIHLVSDSTGETLNAMARAVCARFTDILPIEHIYALVRSPRQLERALEEISVAPGLVMHTIIDPTLRTALEEGCRRLEMPCIAVLDPVVSTMARYLGARISTRVGAQHALDNDYFDRMEALNYAIAHDDGAGGDNLNQADVILTGVSRTSKTPTSIYLAHRGIRAANVPLIPGQGAPAAPELRAGDLVRIHEVPDDPANDAALARAGIPKPAFYLVRPDGHVGLCGARVDAAAIARHLAERVRLRP